MSIKRCAHCLQEKRLEEFHWNNKAKGKRQKHCKKCMRKFNRESYERNKEAYRSRIYKNAQVRRGKILEFLEEYLQSHPCVDCGESNIAVLEFDHVRGQKRNDISTMLKDGYGLTSIKEELAKCEVRCANCHRIKTSQNRGWWR